MTVVLRRPRAPCRPGRHSKFSDPKNFNIFYPQKPKKAHLANSFSGALSFTHTNSKSLNKQWDPLLSKVGFGFRLHLRLGSLNFQTFRDEQQNENRIQGHHKQVWVNSDSCCQEYFWPHKMAGDSGGVGRFWGGRERVVKGQGRPGSEWVCSKLEREIPGNEISYLPLCSKQLCQHRSVETAPELAARLGLNHPGVFLPFSSPNNWKSRVGVGSCDQSFDELYRHIVKPVLRGDNICVLSLSLFVYMCVCVCVCGTTLKELQLFQIIFTQRFVQQLEPTDSELTMRTHQNSKRRERVIHCNLLRTEDDHFVWWK